MADLEPFVTYQNIPITDQFYLDRTRGVGPDNGGVNLPVDLIDELEPRGNLVLFDGERQIIFGDIWIDKQGAEAVQTDENGIPTVFKMNLSDERWILQDYGPDDGDAVRDINIILKAPSILGSGSKTYRKDSLKEDGTRYNISEIIEDLLSSFENKDVVWKGKNQVPIVDDVRFRWNTYASAIQELLERSGGDTIHLCLDIDGTYSIWPESENEDAEDLEAGGGAALFGGAAGAGGGFAGDDLPEIDDKYLNVFEGTRFDNVPEVTWVVGSPIQVDELVLGWVPVCPLDQDYVSIDKDGNVVNLKKGDYVPLLALHGENLRGGNISIERLWDIKRDPETGLFAQQRIVNFAVYNSYTEGAINQDPNLFAAAQDLPFKEDRIELAKEHWLKTWQIPNPEQEPNKSKLPILPERCFTVSETSELERKTIEYIDDDGELQKKTVKGPSKKEIEAQEEHIEKINAKAGPAVAFTTFAEAVTPADGEFSDLRNHLPYMVKKAVRRHTNVEVKDYNTGLVQFGRPLFSVRDFYKPHPDQDYVTIFDIGLAGALTPAKVGIRYTYEKKQYTKSDYFAYYQTSEGESGNAHLDAIPIPDPTSRAKFGRSKLIKDPDLILCQYTANPPNSDAFFQDEEYYQVEFDKFTFSYSDLQDIRGDFNLRFVNEEAKKLADRIYSRPSLVNNRRVEAWGFHEVNCTGLISSVRWESDGDRCKTIFKINDATPIGGGQSEQEKTYDIDNSVAPPQVDYVASKPSMSTHRKPDMFPDTSVHLLFSDNDEIHNDRKTELAVAGKFKENTPGAPTAFTKKGALKGGFDYRRDWAGQFVKHDSADKPNVVFRPKNVVFRAQIVRVYGNTVIVKRESDDPFEVVT